MLQRTSSQCYNVLPAGTRDIRADHEKGERKSVASSGGSRVCTGAGNHTVQHLRAANNDSAEWNGISRHLCGNWRQRVSGRVPCVEATMAFQGILPWLVAGTTPDKNLTRHEVLAKRKGKRTVLRRRVWLIVIFSSK